MLRYIYARDLNAYPDLAHSMFVDRADQFETRLGWPVHVDANGEERDEYDALNPLYVIWEQPDGRHGGSMRFLPTTGPVMLNDVFGHLTDGNPICSPLVWECTRFCLSREVSGKIAGALTLGGLEIMKNFKIAHFAGVVDRRMVRIYRGLGFSPEVVRSAGRGRDRISLGLWEYDRQSYDRVAQRAGILPARSQYWFDLSFGGVQMKEPMCLTG